MPDIVQLDHNATESDITNALDALPSGGTLLLPRNTVVQITQGLTIDLAARDVTIDLNGSTLVQADNARVITALGSHGPLTPVDIGQNAEGHATITYGTAPEGLAVGDWLKVVSDDPIPGDHIDPSDNGQPTRLGQAAQVTAVEGNTVTLDRELVDQDLYVTNVRASEYQSGHFTLQNGTITGDPSLQTDLVHLRTAIAPEVNNLTLRSGQGSGINIVDSVNARITDCITTDLGAGVHSASSLNTTVNGLFAEHVQHGIFDNSVGVPPGWANVSQYGADIGLHGENSVVYDATRAAYDFHSEAVGGSYVHDLAFQSRMFGDFRGFENAFIDSAGAGNDYGVQFLEYGHGDARRNLIDNLTLRETMNYTFIVSNQPADNLVRDSSFESYGIGYRVPASVATFENTQIIEGVKQNDDVLTGTAQSDYLLGGRGTDVVSGQDGDDYIWGGRLADALTGGEGRDRFAYHSFSEAGDIITDFQTGPAGDVIDVAVLAAREGWPRGDLVGDGVVQAVQSGDNTLVQANDETGAPVTLATLSNVDAAAFSSANVQVLLSGTLPPPVENTTIMGGPDNDVLTGTAANDTLDGGAGADRMAGGPGDDTYYVDDPQDQVIEAIGEGNDIAYAQVDYTLPAGSEVERLRANADSDTGLALAGNEFDNQILGGGGDDALRGAQGNDSLEGQDGNDVLNGGPGADVMTGGAGNDTYYVDHASDQIVEAAGDGSDTVHASASYSLPENAAIEFLRANAAQLALKGNGLPNTIYGSAGVDALDGGAGNDAIAALAGADSLNGGDGDDRLDGGQGADVQIGGAGNDVFSVDDPGDVIVEYVGDGFDQVNATAPYTLPPGAEVEVLRSAGSAAPPLTGNDLDNTIYGLAGADTLSGEGGQDSLFGGAGADTLIGGAGNDRLDGGPDRDTLAGGLGNDVYFVDNTSDSVTEAPAEGTDTVFAGVSYALAPDASVELLRAYGTSQDLTLTGNEAANTLQGGAGSDTLIGGGGNDLLIGGASADVFVFDVGAGKDQVADFAPGEDIASFDASQFADVNDVIADATQVGSDVVIAAPESGDTVTLQQLALADLHASDFVIR